MQVECCKSSILMASDFISLWLAIRFRGDFKAATSPSLDPSTFMPVYLGVFSPEHSIQYGLTAVSVLPTKGQLFGFCRLGFNA